MAGRIFSLRGSPFASSLPAVVGGRGGDGRSPPPAFRTSAQLCHHVGSLPSPCLLPSSLASSACFLPQLWPTALTLPGPTTLRSKKGQKSKAITRGSAVSLLNCGNTSTDPVNGGQILPASVRMVLEFRHSSHPCLFFPPLR